MLDHTRCVVLNASYEPLSIVSARRGLRLVMEGRAIVGQEHPTAKVRSEKQTWPVPTQVVLRKYVKSPSVFRKPAQLTNRNLFTRDHYTCQYCGRQKRELRHSEKLTREHIHPLEKGGKNEWLNVVTACNTCNNKKANMYLEKAFELFGMRLLTKPTVPTVFEIWAKTDLPIPQQFKGKVI